MLNLLPTLDKKTDTQKIFQKERTEFEDSFYRVMFELDLYNKFAKTYKLVIDSKENYGFKGRLFLESGLSYQDLEQKKGKIQDNLRCIWIMKYENFQECAHVKIVTKPLDPKIPYENPNIKPHEMALGLDFSLQPIINNNYDNCHFLIAGATGVGKTRFLYSILLSWILSCLLNECELYISDIAKNEYINFQWCKHVRYYAQELEELLNMLRYINIKLEKRKKILAKYREMGKATDIKEYNQISGSKMSHLYILIDEFSIIVPDKTDDKEEKIMKEQILDFIKRFEKIGRSCGIFLIIATQKTVKDELPSIIKNMSAVRISFRANDFISSEVIIGDNSAVGLSDRYAVYSQNGGDKKDYLFSPMLTTERLNELLKRHIDRNFKKVDIEAELKGSIKVKVENVKVTKKPKKLPHETFSMKGEEFSDC